MAKQKGTFMRASKEVLNELKKCKISKGESYEEVIKRLMKNNAFAKWRLKK